MNTRTHQAAKSFMASIVNNHVGKNIRRYTIEVHVNEVRYNALGDIGGHTAQEGKVVEIGPDFTVVKRSNNSFGIIDNGLLAVPVQVGDKIRYQGYNKRRFDGTLADGSEDPAEGGARTFMLTGVKTYFPVKWDGRYLGVNEKFADTYTEISNPYLRDLITQMETASVNEGRRAVVNVLVDAGATNLRFNDSSEDDIISDPPAIHCDVANDRFKGHVEVNYDRGMDYYRLVLTRAEDGHVERIEDIDVFSLGQVLIDAIDDGNWLKVRVTVLQPAAKSRKTATI